MLWGIGHTVTVFAVGSTIILFNLAIPHRLEMAMEFCVAIMLVVLGLVNLSWVRRDLRATFTPGRPGIVAEHGHEGHVSGRHVHLHVHGDYVHAHQHGHAPATHGHTETPLSWLDRHLGGLGVYQALRPLCVGIVHGLAGSAAVALLVLAQIHEPVWAVGYLLLFGVGTTAGMMLLTAAIAVPFLGASRLPVLKVGMQLVGGALSLGLGCYMAWRIGVSDGLFAAQAAALSPVCMA